MQPVGKRKQLELRERSALFSPQPQLQPEAGGVFLSWIDEDLTLHQH
jgi:hypothetical protein